MKKILILIFGILIAFTAAAQINKPELVEIIKRWPNRIDINVTDGLTHKRTVSDQSDTAFYFHANGKKFIATTTFKEVGGTLPPVDIIDSTTIDSEEGVIFSTGWTGHGTTTAPGWYRATIAYSTVANTTASYTFTGRQVKIYAERLPSHGSGTVTILQGTTVIKTGTVFFAGPKLLPVKVYDSGILPDGTYTIRLKADGNGPAPLDYFRIFKKR